MNMKRAAGIAAGAAVSILLLVLSFYKADLHALARSFHDIDTFSLALCVLFICLSDIVRSLLWRVTTRRIKPIPLSTLFGGVVVGYLVNTLLPFRAGELFRAQFLTSMAGVRRSTALSTIFIERVFDIFSLGFVLVLCLRFGIPGLSFRASELVLGVWLACIAAAVLLVLNLDTLERKERHPAFLPDRLLESIIHFLAPLRQLRSPGNVFALFVLIMAVWLCNYLSLLELIGHSAAVTKGQAALILFLFVNLGMLLPSTPGALGVIQVAFWMALSRYGVPKEQALALSFAYLGVMFLFNLGVGMPYFMRAHLKLGRIPEAS